MRYDGPGIMSTKIPFPSFRWVAQGLSGRWVRRSYVAVLLLLLLLTTAARLRSYLTARKIQAVLHGLAEIRIDQTTEEQLLRTVPYLTRGEQDWNVRGIIQRVYFTEISNEPNGPISWSVMYGPGWQLAYWLGYRYMDFDAGVLVQDGKVSRVGYGLAKEWGRPRELSYIISAKSVHGFWLPHEHPFAVTSQDDESPQYRVEQREVLNVVGREQGLIIIFTNDAPPELTKRAFQLNLSCFWSLRGCGDARDIAPGLWQDAQTIKAATYQQLISEKCPDSIIEGRMRYLPDITVLLLEVTGSRRIEVNEEGARAEDWFTDYTLKEVIRGRSFGSWNNVRFRRTIPSPMDPTQTIANQKWPPAKIGTQVLFFGGLDFYSCRFIPATPSALEIVRKTPTPAKRPEDEIVQGLQ